MTSTKGGISIERYSRSPSDTANDSGIKVEWRNGDPDSKLLLDIAAGRPLSLDGLSREGFFLAHRHGLVGLLADGPSAIRTQALPSLIRLAARQQVMIKHLQRLLAEFQARSIPATVLKGPHLAETVYRASNHRTYTDIDVLVPREHLLRVLDVLSQDTGVSSIPAQGPKADKRNISMLDRSGVRFTLDLHWDLFSYSQLQRAAEGATEESWERAIGPENVTYGPSWVLPEEATVAFLCTHALLDHRFRLILFRDLTEVAARRPDWERVARFAQRWGLRSTTYVALLMASRITDAEVPAAFLSELRPRTLAIGTTERLLQTTNVVRFNGHKAHPLNLSIVLLHDTPSGSLRLAMRAPIAFPQWKRRVTTGIRSSQRVSKAEVQTVRVLHLLPADRPRGAQTYAKALRERLDSFAIEHRTATLFRSPANTLQPDFDLDVKAGLGSRLGFSPLAWFRLRSLLRRWKPEVVVAHGGESLKYAVVAADRSTKLAYYKIGTAKARLRNPVRRIIHASLVQRADLVAGVSNELVLEARGLLGARPERTLCIPNGRDPQGFQDVASPAKPGPVCFLFVGHLTRTKRPGKFVKVITALRERGLEAHGLVVGDGPLLDSLRTSDPAEVEFLGPRDDVPELMSKAHVFLFTSISDGEGMPGVLIEAGMAGLPVISTDVPGARTVIEDGVSGYVVAVKDEIAFIDAAETLARQPDLRKSMGAAGRARCLERFTLSQSVSMWETEISKLLHG